MIIKAITVPTPSRIKKKIKKYCSFTYEVIEKTDPEILNMIYKNPISAYPKFY